MWAFRRRASSAIRCYSYRFGYPQACCAKLDALGDNLEHVVVHHDYGQSSIAIRCLVPAVPLHVPSIPVKYILRCRGHSSEAGAKNSGNEDLEDGLSELEMPPNIDDVRENLVGGDSADEVVSGPELSDGELERNLPEATGNELEESQKRATSPLFKVIMDAPRHSIDNAIDKWVAEGNIIGRVEISIAMHNLRIRRMFGRALQLSEWVEANKQLELVEHDYASRLDLIVKVHSLQKAEKYMERIPVSFKGEVVYRTLLANYAVHNNLKKAEEVFNKMRDLGFPLTAFSCNQLLLLYRRFNRRKISDILLLMDKENVKPTQFTYRLLIDAKGRVNDITGMEQVLEAMKAEGIEPRVSTKAAVSRHYISGGFRDKAEMILKQIEGNGVEENREISSTLLRLYASLGKADEVGRIWKVCEVRPRLDECMAAIESWGKLGHVEIAEAVFQKVLKTWKSLTSKHYTILLKVYADHKMLAKGKDLVKQMSDNGCTIGPFTWDALVKLYVEAGEVEKADSILQKAMQQNPVKPLFSTYAAVLDKYAKRGDIHNSEKIFHRSREAGYVGRIQQYQALLEAYVNAKTPAYGFKERMMADGILPNKVVAGQLAQISMFNKTSLSSLLD